tara:strand:+ start:1285 stop:1491 length:207 start_codon:yes stop_codon:yes gene_type:complete
VARITTQQIRDAVVEVSRDKGRPATYEDVQHYFGMSFPQHARYYVRLAVEAGLIKVDRERQPHWLEAV